MRKHGLKALGLALLAALGLMAIMASAAQAELTNDSVLVNGLPLGATESKNVSGTVGPGELLTAGNLKIHCNSGNITGKVFGNGSATATVLYNECEVLENPFCEIYETLEDWEKGVNKGHIKASGSGQVFQHEGKHYLLVEGSGATKLFTDFGFAGELCTLPSFDGGEHQTITGSTVFALPDALTSQANHSITTIDPATLATLFPNDKLKLGEEAAHLAAGTTASVHLEGTPNWSVK